MTRKLITCRHGSFCSIPADFLFSVNASFVWSHQLAFGGNLIANTWPSRHGNTPMIGGLSSFARTTLISVAAPALDA